MEIIKECGEKSQGVIKEWSEKSVLIVPSDTTFLALLYPGGSQSKLDEVLIQDSYKSWYVFENATKCFEVFPWISPSIRFVITCLAPGPIQFQVFNPRSRKHIQIYIPQSDSITEILNQVGGYAIGHPASVSDWPPATHINMVESYFSDIAIPVVEGECVYGIEPTWLDMSHPNRVKVMRPGPIASNQLRSVLSQHVLLTHAYKHHYYWQVEHEHGDAEIHLGSTENVEKGGIILGSQTNPRLMARRVLETIWKLRQQNMKILLDIPEGKNMFFHAIRFAIGKYA